MLVTFGQVPRVFMSADGICCTQATDFRLSPCQDSEMLFVGA